MNDFYYQELLAKEYRRDLIANAAKHNQVSPQSGTKLNLSIYRSLSRMGELLENMGSKMQERYERLAKLEEYNILPNPAK